MYLIIYWIPLWWWWLGTPLILQCCGVIVYLAFYNVVILATLTDAE